MNLGKNIGFLLQLHDCKGFRVKPSESARIRGRPNDMCNFGRIWIRMEGMRLREKHAILSRASVIT